MSGYDKARRRMRTVIVAAALAPALLLSTGAAQAAAPHPAPVPAPRSAPRAMPHGAPPEAEPAAADPWIVSLGDSYISGEGGRWAGNTDDSYTKVDALGPTAYYDNPTNTGELIPLCHRSKSAEIHIGGGVNSLNLACSGAQTSTFTNSDGDFKPGLDFYNVGGHQGQALMLENFAKTHHVTMVAVSIGGNDFGFGDIVTACVKAYLESTPIHDFYCKDDSAVTQHFAPANVALVTSHITQALLNVRTAMARAGYADSSYKILLQNYPAPLPYGAAFRYPESGYARQTTGGCGMWNADVDWALNTAMPNVSSAEFTAAARSGLTNIVKLDISSAFHTRRLCQNTVGLLEEEGLNSWTSPGAVDKTEWIDQIRIATLGTPYFQQESLHPNYWGQLALRNCVRQAYDNGAIRGGSCVMAGTGRDARGEPNMALTDTTVLAGLDTAARAYAKQGLYSGAWAEQGQPIRQVAVASDPVHGPVVAVLVNAGNLWVRQGSLTAPWVQEAVGVSQIAVATDPVHGVLLGVRLTGGSVFAKQGLNGTWVHERDNVAQVSVATDFAHGPLIGVLGTDNVAYAKEGSLTAGWVQQSGGVHQIAVAANPLRGPLITVIGNGSAAWAREGSLTAPWVHEADGVAEIADASDSVHGPLIAYVGTGRTLWAKQGSLTAPWVREYDNVTQAAVATDPVHGPLISALDTARVWRAKQGGLSANWVIQRSDIVQVAAAS